MKIIQKDKAKNIFEKAGSIVGNKGLLRRVMTSPRLLNTAFKLLKRMCNKCKAITLRNVKQGKGIPLELYCKQCQELVKEYEKRTGYKWQG